MCCDYQVKMVPVVHDSTPRVGLVWVVRAVARSKITVEDMSKLPYITAVMRETLRLKPTAPMIALSILAATLNSFS